MEIWRARRQKFRSDASSGRPGIIDVAAHAGVSHITVSRVINDDLRVRPETRARVVAALQELGYQPNNAARALVTGRSQTIGVICYNTALYGPAAALLGLEQTASENGYFVNIIGLKTLDRKAVEDAVRRLRQQAVAGRRHGLSPIRDGQSLPAPAGRHSDRRDLGLCGNAGAGRRVGRNGRRERRRPVICSNSAIATCGISPDPRDASARRIASAAGARRWRRPASKPPPLLFGDWSAQSGHAAAKELIADKSVTAIFVGNDQMALGVLRAIHEAGRTRPGRHQRRRLRRHSRRGLLHSAPDHGAAELSAQLGRETMQLLLGLMRGESACGRRRAAGRVDRSRQHGRAAAG